MHRGLINKASTSHHGDLKSENIFVFREVDADIISTADFGVSRFHRKSTDDRRKAKEYTETVIGTTRYMSPESRDANQVPRKLGFWYLGCLFIDFIIWATWGLGGLDTFNQLDNDEFWQKRNNSYIVGHDNITRWIDIMKTVLLSKTALEIYFDSSLQAC